MLRRREHRDALIRVVDRIHLLGLRSGIETEIMRELVRGRRTTRELVDVIYSEDSEASTFESYYAKIRRALKNLHSKGLITSSLFGREKVYRLTRHGDRTLISVAVGYPQPRLLGNESIALFSVTSILGLLSIVGVKFIGNLSPLVSTIFFILLGASLFQAVLIIREVG